MKSNKGKLEAGFTLVELLFVAAIIALIATVISVSITATRRKARDAKRVQDIQSIYFAVMTYFVEHGEYPLTEPSTHLANFRGHFLPGAFDVRSVSYINVSNPAENLHAWSDLESKLSSYIYPLPKDPRNNVPNTYYYNILVDASGESVTVYMNDSGFGRVCTLALLPSPGFYAFRGYVTARFEDIQPKESCLSAGEPNEKIIYLP